MAVKAEVTIKGVGEFQDALRAFEETAVTAAKAALFEEAETIMARSKDEFVPVDDGPLRSSGHVQLPVVEGSTVSVTMGYGGPAVPYALAVHEHLSEHSPPSWVAAEAAGRPVTFHPPGRGPKYLEIPALEAEQGMAGRLAEKFRAAFARLRGRRR